MLEVIVNNEKIEIDKFISYGFDSKSFAIGKDGIIYHKQNEFGKYKIFDKLKEYRLVREKNLLNFQKSNVILRNGIIEQIEEVKQ